jgi:molybdopterin-guanine dinucleotide biosynthesis protein MobB
VATRLVSIVGRKNAGKTTLTVALAAEFARRGRRVMTLKHAHHPAAVDREGTDSWRHFNEGGAERTLLATPDLRVLFERTADDYDPIGLARRYLDGADIVLAEGFRSAPLPKVEVYRPVVATPSLYEAAGADAARWAAIVTDDASFRADCLVLRFGDTNWLQNLAAIAWESALEVA